jgi:uncharacterized protein (DUF305 family)
MDFKETISNEKDRSSGSWSNPLVLLIFGILLILMIVVGYWAGRRAVQFPGNDSAEAGFSRDMAEHHAQAVNLAQLQYDRTDDPEIRQMTLDIMLTQQAQIGQMRGWLSVWGLPAASTIPAMSWMGMPMTDSMPGMATPEDINRLRRMQSLEADGLFLQLMIPHHRGGVAMANAILERTKLPEVRTLAQFIVDSQTSEITLMQSLLKQKGFPAIPEEKGTNDIHEMPMP